MDKKMAIKRMRTISQIKKLNRNKIFENEIETKKQIKKRIKKINQ